MKVTNKREVSEFKPEPVYPYRLYDLVRFRQLNLPLSPSREVQGFSSCGAGVENMQRYQESQSDPGGMEKIFFFLQNQEIK